MADIQVALLLAAAAAAVWYLKRGLDAESVSRGVLEPKALPAAGRAAAGLRQLLLCHAVNLALSIPLLAPPPDSIDEGHSMLRWLAALAWPWLRWAGLTQLVYAWPLCRRLKDLGRPAAARAAGLAAGATLAVSGLAWSVLPPAGPHPSFSLQAACGVISLACAVALVWLVRELGRCLRR